MTYNFSIQLNNGRTFKIASDFKFGFQNWGGSHKERNPFGMQELDSYEAFLEKLEEWEKFSGTRVVGMAWKLSYIYRELRIAT